MGVLNRKKAGAAGPGGPGEEFFNAAEASQLNTLLRGKSGPAASEGDGGGSELNSQGAAAGAQAEMSSEYQSFLSELGVDKVDLTLLHSPPCVPGATWNQGCIGHPAQDPEVKPRLPVSVMLKENSYSIDGEVEAIASYDGEMRNYYATRSANIKIQGWSEQMAGLLGRESRLHMRPFLEGKGFLKR